MFAKPFVMITDLRRGRSVEPHTVYSVQKRYQTMMKPTKSLKSVVTELRFKSFLEISMYLH